MIQVTGVQLAIYWRKIFRNRLCAATFDMDSIASQAGSMISSTLLEHGPNKALPFEATLFEEVTASARVRSKHYSFSRRP